MNDYIKARSNFRKYMTEKGNYILMRPKVLKLLYEFETLMKKKKDFTFSFDSIDEVYIEILGDYFLERAKDYEVRRTFEYDFFTEYRKVNMYVYF